MQVISSVINFNAAGNENLCSPVTGGAYLLTGCDRLDLTGHDYFAVS